MNIENSFKITSKWLQWWYWKSYSVRFLFGVLFFFFFFNKGLWCVCLDDNSVLNEITRSGQTYNKPKNSVMYNRPDITKSKTFFFKYINNNVLTRYHKLTVYTICIVVLYRVNIEEPQQNVLLNRFSAIRRSLFPR